MKRRWIALGLLAALLGGCRWFEPEPPPCYPNYYCQPTPQVCVPQPSTQCPPAVVRPTVPR
jgi:hypothetical protein